MPQKSSARSNLVSLQVKKLRNFLCACEKVDAFRKMSNKFLLFILQTPRLELWLFFSP